MICSIIALPCHVIKSKLIDKTSTLSIVTNARKNLLSGGILEGPHEVDDVRHGLVDGAAEDAGVKVHGATLDL